MTSPVRLNLRALLAMLHDLAASALAWLLSYWLRFNLDIPPEYMQNLVETLPWVVVLQATCFHAFGLYRGMWRYASLPDLKRIVDRGRPRGASRCRCSSTCCSFRVRCRVRC